MDKRFREEGIGVAFPQRTVSYMGDRGKDERPKIHMPPVKPTGA